MERSISFEIIFIFVLFVVMPIETNPQSEELRLRFSPVTFEYNLPFLESTTLPNEEEVIIEPMKEFQDDPVQCLYDYKGNRVSRGCLSSQTPLKCEKGLLVLTMVGTEFEMCCCNYLRVS